VAHHVTKGDHVVHFRVIELQCGQVVAYGFVDVQLAVVFKHADKGGGKGFGAGTDGKERVGSDRYLMLPILVAESPGIDDRILVYDRDGEAGGMPVFKDARKGGVEAGERAVVVVMCLRG